MYFMEDEQLARMIQFGNSPFKESPQKPTNHKRTSSDIIDSKLEILDPTPNIHALFVKFNQRFFWGSLGMVEVKWSQKMTTCAGICYYHGNNGLCSISLSAPLLSLRPRKDLVETLLHEMIHAYLFVTANRKDREDHGPEFHKHMDRINNETGTKISVYHTFHDEVAYYQKHIWRCNGPCQHRKPFFGLVRRASNRAPGPNDFWWDRHKQDCEGTFEKISEPDNFKKPKFKKDAKGKVSPKSESGDIRNFFTPNASPPSTSNNPPKSNVVTFKDLNNDNKPKGGMGGMTANKGSGTLVITERKGKGKETGKTETETETVNKVKKEPKTEKPKKKVGSPKKKVESPRNNSGCPANCTCKKCLDESRKVKETVRNFWADKFPTNKPTPTENGKSLAVPEPGESSSKIKKLECPICGNGFPESEIENHVNHCLENSASGVDNDCEIVEVPLTNGANEGTNRTKETEHNDKSKGEELVDCPVCGENLKQNEVAEHLESCLKCSFENDMDECENDIDEEGNQVEMETKKVPCPCCMEWFPEIKMDEHVDECLTMVALKNGLVDS